MRKPGLLLPILCMACGPGEGPPAADLAPPLPMICVQQLKAPVLAGTAACPAPRPQAPDGLDAALQVAGLTRCDVQIPAAAAALSGFPPAGDDPQRLPEYDGLHGGPLRLPGWLHAEGAQLDAALDGAGPASGALAVAALRRGKPLSGCLDLSAYAEAAASAQPLALAAAQLISSQGGEADAAVLSAQVAGVPLELQRALVPVVAALDNAARVVLEARGTQDEDVLTWLAQNGPRVILTGAALNDTRLRQLRAVNVDKMLQAAALLAASVEQAGLPALAQRLGAVPPVGIDTPIGALVLRGAGADRHDAAGAGDRVALLVDLGGDDDYQLPAGAATMDLPVSLLVDAGGADTYGYPVKADPEDRPGRLPADAAGRFAGAGRGRTLSRVGRQGSGVLGIGMLLDLGQGADRYRSLALSQGSAVLGVGVLYDEGGDDDYRAEVHSQGAASWGVGLLLDRGGEDAYRSYSLSQGFGYTGGIGVLADGAGDDLYFVNPGDPKVMADPELPAVGGDPMYASAQLPMDGNNSMSQGCGFGRRADFLPDMLFMAGGHGLLYDRRGDDRYLASVFAQGCGYYRGIGALLDHGGDDTYEGLWYVQGAAAHVSIGVLVDDAGADRYNPSFPIRATSIGTSNDFSVGLHADLGGDDSYRAPGLSLGSGYAQGFGILINLGGSDRYQAAGYPTLGGATISREFPFTIPRAQQKTLGLFCDLGGADTYAVPTDGGFQLPAKDGKSWSFAQVARDEPTAPKSEKSAGLDDDAGAAALE